MITRAAVKVEYGQPLAVEEIELPDPQPNQLVVKLYASGICHSQLHQLHNADAATPALLGHEATGVVVEAGRDVPHVKEGDRVLVTWVPRDTTPDADPTQRRTSYTFRGEQHVTNGVYTWSEHVLAHEQLVLPLPDDVPTDVTSIIGCAVVTGVGAVLGTAQVQRGQSVAVFGVGGVGMNVLAGAKIAGADPIIAIDLAEEKLKFAKEFGATDTVNAAETDAVEAIRELTGRGVDFAFDAIGAEPTSRQIIESVRPGVLGAERGGTAVLVGIPQQEITIPRGMFPGGERSYIGSLGGSSHPIEDFPRYVEWYRQGELPLDKMVTKRYGSLDDIHEGVRALEAGEIEGRSIMVYAKPD